MLMRIPFPSISICHSQTVIDYQSRQFVNSIKIPDGVSREDIVKMLPSALGVFTENQWGPVNTEYLNTVHETLLLNGLSILDAVKAVGISCSDFIQRCSFNKKRFPCFQDHQHFTFRETMSYAGMCCSFNYNPDNSSYQPLNVNSYGVRGGLSVIATSSPHSNDGTSGLLFSDGFILFMHSPYDFPTEATSMALLEVGKITAIGIYPTISTLSADVNALPLVSRRCLTGNDVGLNYYSQATCRTKCMTQFIYDKCECHPYFVPATDNYSRIRDCAVTDGECFQRIYYDMRKIRCRECWPACEDISYKMSTATIPYNFANVSINPIYDQTNLSKSEFTAHIYFAGSKAAVRKTIISESFVELLSNFGGVFNLVLGVSLFSILELFYYFCYKIPQLMQRYSKIRPVITTIQTKNKHWKQ
ncbi:sodium channel protein Nach [Bradysia coprophila]|uniref:sodium channel protein Nach n=1 Tax=Bradysia coprophila TaxID=38358 RepID=UPI00187DD1A3|nr:sodium channel protein Nach [Bradysia coprophila]